MKSLHRINREFSGTGIKAEMAFFGRKKRRRLSHVYCDPVMSKRVQAVAAWPSGVETCQAGEAALDLSKHVQASGDGLDRNGRGGGRSAARAGLLAHPRVPQQLRSRRQTTPGSRLVGQDSIPRGAPDGLARRGGSGCGGGEGGRPVRPASASRLAGAWLT